MGSGYEYSKTTLVEQQQAASSSRILWCRICSAVAFLMSILAITFIALYAVEAHKHHHTTTVAPPTAIVPTNATQQTTENTSPGPTNATQTTENTSEYPTATTVNLTSTAFTVTTPPVTVTIVPSTTNNVTDTTSLATSTATNPPVALSTFGSTTGVSTDTTGPPVTVTDTTKRPSVQLLETTPSRTTGAQTPTQRTWLPGQGFGHTSTRKQHAWTATPFTMDPPTTPWSGEPEEMSGDRVVRSVREKKRSNQKLHRRLRILTSGSKQ